jgi:Skp family chaperone for outer membrane proteins
MGVSFSARRLRTLAAHASLLAALAALAAAPPAGAAEGIGVIDYQLLFDRYEGTADAQRSLDLEMKEWEQSAKEKRDEIAKLKEELESQRLMLSEERLKEKEEAYRLKKEEYETFAESIFGVSGKAAQRNAELTKPIAERILASVEKIGRERNLKIILDAGTGGVVWAEDDVNVTQIVLDELTSSAAGAATPNTSGDPKE